MVVVVINKEKKIDRMPRYTSSEKYYSLSRGTNDFYGSAASVSRKSLTLDEIDGIGDLSSYITWKSSKIDSVDVFISFDDVPFVLVETVPNNNIYQFTFRWYSPRCRVMIVDSTDPNMFSISDYFVYLFVPRVAFLGDLITPAPTYNNSVAFLGDQITDANPATTGIIGNFGFKITDPNPATTGILASFGEKIFPPVIDDYTWSQLSEKLYNGSSEYEIITPSISSGLTTFTVSLYIKTTENRNSGTYWQRPCIIGDSTADGYSGDFGINSNSGYIGIWNGLNNDNGVVSSKLINDDVYYHVCCTYNNSVMILYVDKIEVCRMNSTGACDTYGWYLMAQHYYTGGANYYHQGTIKEVKIYNRCLTSQEIDLL
jgi:hypothetical protein